MNYEYLLAVLYEEYKHFPKLDHLKGTSQTAYALAKKFLNNKTDKAKVAGFLHDIARFFEPNDMIKYVQNSRYPISKEERDFPILLHGKAAAVIAEQKYKVKDEEILFSIINHVTGTFPMDTLSKIIFIADVIEPTRTFDGVGKLREAAFNNIERAFVLVLSNKLLWLIKKGHYISTNTINLWNKIVIFKEESN